MSRIVTENTKRILVAPIDTDPRRGLQCKELEIDYVYFHGSFLTVYFKQGIQTTVDVAGAVADAVAVIETTAFNFVDPPR